MIEADNFDPLRPPRNWTAHLMAARYDAEPSDPNLRVFHDPLSIGVGILVNFGYSGAISALGATLLGGAVIGAAILGLTIAANALRPRNEEPKASDRQATLRQTFGPRWRFYGQVKVGGTLWFFESRDGILYVAITLNEGQISSVEEIWLNDQQVTLDANGYVIEAPYAFSVTEDGGIFGGGTTTDYKVARLYFKLGTVAQTAFTQLTSVFSEVTSAHRGRGIAHVLAMFNEVPADKISEVYPQGNPGVRVVMKSSLIKDVRTGVVGYSDNLSDIIYDYLCGVDGAGVAYGAGLLESQVDLPSFQEYAATCAEDVPLKNGGSEKRYSGWGGYALNEEMRTVLDRMCKAGDATLYIKNNGKMAIRGGKWTAPALTFDHDLGHVIHGEFRKGRGALAAFNELTLSYTEPNQDYQETEGEPWRDDANIALRGQVLSSSLSASLVHSHSQIRRLGKILTAKSNPEWSGTIVTNFYGLNALGEETVWVKFPAFGIDQAFLVQSVKVLDDLTGAQIEISSLSSDAYDWDPITEEGDGPITPPDTSDTISLDPVANFHLSATNLMVGGSSTGTYIVATWTPPSRASLGEEVDYRPSTGGSWVAMAVSPTIGVATSALVVDGASYDIRYRTVSAGSVFGDYTYVSITATANVASPTVVTGLSAIGGIGEVALSWTQPSSTNAIAGVVYRNTVNTFGTATAIATKYGSPLTTLSYTDAGLSAGTYYYWVVAVNGMAGVSASVATGAVVVT